MNIITLNTNIITLKKSNTLKNINDINDLNPVIIKGIDGKLIEKNNYNLKYFNSMFLPKSVIGCAMSHIKCWKKHILKNNNYTLILEDDFFINKDILNDYKQKYKKQKINNLIKFFILNTPKDFDILYLGFISGNYLQKYFNLISYTNKSKNINDLIEKPLLHLGLHSYILSNNGILKLLNNINNNKINFHLDYYIQKLASKNILNTYSLKNRLFYQTSTYIPNISQNISYIICPFFKNYFIDEYVTLNYILNVSLLSIFNININLWIIFLIVIITIFFSIIIKKLKKS